LDQTAPEALQELLWARMRALPGSTARASQIAPPGSRAIWLDAAGLGPAAFMIGREFAHLHPREDGSLHMVLDPATHRLAMEAGWAERHPLAGKFAPAGTVMIYGPRDAAELETVCLLVLQSHRFASGEIPLPDDYGDDEDMPPTQNRS
jgi:phospholipase/carboxylesterase